MYLDVLKCQALRGLLVPQQDLCHQAAQDYLLKEEETFTLHINMTWHMS